MSLRRRVIGQFSYPRGLLGHVAGWILAWRSSNKARNRWVVRLLALGSADRVLEVGCGPGVALSHCLASGLCVRTTGLDRSGVMIAQARKRNREAVKSGRLELFEGEIEALPSSIEPFDRVFSINVVQFAKDRSAFLAALACRVKQGGLLLTACQPRHSTATHEDAVRLAEELRVAMAALGFDGISIEELPLKPVPAICVLGRKAGPT